jgi:hypothetical protein
MRCPRPCTVRSQPGPRSRPRRAPDPAGR